MSFKQVLYLITTSLIIMMYIIPHIKTYLPINILAILTFIYSLFYIFPNIRTNICRRIILSLAPFIFIMFTVTWNFDFHYGALLTITNMWNFLFPGFLLMALLARNNDFDTNFLLLFSFVMVLYVMYNSYLGMQENEAIMRSLANGNIDEDIKNYYMSKGVGGYGFSYSLGLITLALFSSSILTKHQYKYIALAFFLIFFIFIINTKYATLLICTCIVFFIIILMHLKTMFARFILLLMLPIFYLVLGEVFHILLEIIGDSVLTDRLNEVYHALWGMGVSSDSDMASRANYRSQCIDYIIESPLWGNDTTRELRFLYTHSHSTLWSHFLGTGIIGLYSYLYSFWITLNYCYGDQKNRNRLLFIVPSFIFFVLISFFNASEFTEISLVLLFINPLIYKTLKKYNIIL